MKKRRSPDVFSLSFLDCICCGFGAVILLFVIVNSRTNQVFPSEQLRERSYDSEQLRLNLRVNLMRRETQQIRDEIATLETQIAAVKNRRDSILNRSHSIKDQLENQGLKPRDSQAQMIQVQTELKIIEKEFIKLQAAIQVAKEKQEARQLRQHAGDGYRHYLTGLSLSGERTLILLDCSASMLSDHIVDILRRRNMDKSSRQQAPKWRQTVAAVDWLLSQLPIDGKFQLIGFHENVFPVLKPSHGQWLQAANTHTVNDVSKALHNLVPEKGTNLNKALTFILAMSPPPDNLVLITDGLPTMGFGLSLLGTVSARRRMSLFKNAIRQIPEALPVNVILYQMEGDPEAASAYWRLAMVTHGSFFCPPRDWP